MLQKCAGSGTARANAGDVGTMYALGTRFAKNGVDFALPYSSNDNVPKRLLRTIMAIYLGRCGEKYFPQVLLVVLRDLESDAGMLPIPPMEGCTSHNGRAGPATMAVLDTPLT
jgi:hypothetical protein